MAYTIGNAMIYTGDGFIENGYVSFEDKIIDVGEMSNNVKLDMDIHGMIVMPAWVNAHTHVYSALARGMSVHFDPKTFTQILEQLWWKLDRNLGRYEIEASAYAAAADFIHNGVATIFDHHSSQNFVKGSLTILKNVIVDVAGMRGVFCHETSDRDGTQLESIAENVDFFRSCKNSNAFSGMMGLHASFTLGDPTLREVSKVCDGKIPIHVHVGEGIEDELYSINDYGISVIERLDKNGLLIPNSIYAHCIHVSDKEVSLIGESGGYIANATQSNMNNSVGVVDLGMLRKHTKVVIGDDGFGFSPLFDFRMTLLAQKLVRKSPVAFSTSDLKSLIDNTFELAKNHLKLSLGRVKVGYAADLMVIDYRPPTPINDSNFWDHVFFGFGSSVKSLFVNGKPLMIDGEIKTFDESEVKKTSREIAKTLWDKM